MSLCVCRELVAVGPFLPLWHNEHKPGRLLVLLGHQQTHLSLKWAGCSRESKNNGDPVSAELRAGQECAVFDQRPRRGGSVVGISGKARLTECLQRLSVHFHKPAATAKTTLAEGFVNIWNFEWLVLLIKHTWCKETPHRDRINVFKSVVTVTDMTMKINHYFLTIFCYYLHKTLSDFNGI